MKNNNQNNYHNKNHNQNRKLKKYTDLTPQKTAYAKIKRAADFVLSGTAIFFLSPLFIGISIAIKKDSKGPVIFRQKRVGIHKSHFEIFKFRTMYAGTPKDMPTHLLENPDAMVTKTGAFLRKYSLDELPQLLNILRGDMSIVGPRPALWNQYDLIEQRDQYGANDVMPGLTGWAQINGRDELEIPVKAKLDGEYVKKFGLFMDLRCIFGTVFAVAGHKGVVEGGTGSLKREKGAQALHIYEQPKDSFLKSDSGRAGKPENICRSGNKPANESESELENESERKPANESESELENESEQKSENKYETKNKPDTDGNTGNKFRDDCTEKNRNREKSVKKILITGAGSYIGTSVKDWLSAFGTRYEVDELDMHGKHWRQYDFSRYDTVFHVAGIAHADTGKVSKEQKQLYYEINRDLAAETAKKAKESGVRQFIYMSSMIVYGESVPVYEGKRRISAKTRPQPANFYGNSKWQGERCVRALESADFKVCILRPPMIYGAGSKGNYQMLSKIASVTPVFPLVKNERSVLHIDHLCEFVRLMIEHEEAGVFFPQDGRYADTSEMVFLIGKAHGRKIRLLKALAPAVTAASLLPGKAGRLASKAFGSFSYDLSMSEYAKGNYRMHNLEQSIFAAEAGKGS